MDPIVKTIFLRIFSYSTSDVDGKVGFLGGAQQGRWFTIFPPTLRARLAAFLAAKPKPRVL